MHKSNRILESFAYAVPDPAPTHQDHWWVVSHPQTPARSCETSKPLSHVSCSMHSKLVDPPLAHSSG